MANTSDLRTGAILKYNNENCAIVEYQHIKPGKGGAYFQVKMRNIKTGKIAEHRFRSGETLEFVRVERHPYQYLYDDGQMLHFMDQNTYEQNPVEREKIGDEFKFLKENGEVQIAFEGDEVLSIELPMHVNLLITHSEPGVRGDTATNVTKPATLESGAVINVPIFINEGDVVRVDTRTGEYIERVKD